MIKTIIKLYYSGYKNPVPELNLYGNLRAFQVSINK